MMIHLAGDFEHPISRGILGAEGPRWKNFVGLVGGKSHLEKLCGTLWGQRAHLEKFCGHREPKAPKPVRGKKFCLDKLFFVLWGRTPHLERLCGES